MKDSVKLFRIFNIDVSFHWSILILLLLSFNALFGHNVYHDSKIASLFASAIFSIGLVFSIVAHEFGHILTGRKFGVGCNGVTMFALGGMAHLSKNPGSPKSEFFIAIAGPIVSFCVSAIMFLLAVLIKLGIDPYILISPAFVMLSVVNFFVGFFNLIPAFPMDGGRVLRSVLWHKTNRYFKSTEISVNVSRFFATCGIFTGILLCLGILGKDVLQGVWIIIVSAFIIFIGNKELLNAKFVMRG